MKLPGEAFTRALILPTCRELRPCNVGPITGRAGTGSRSTDSNYTAGTVRCIAGLCSRRPAIHILAQRSVTLNPKVDLE
jgi:hypothetical protein